MASASCGAGWINIKAYWSRACVAPRVCVQLRILCSGVILWPIMYMCAIISIYVSGLMNMYISGHIPCSINILSKRMM